MDIPVTITMEVGHAKISIRNLLQLNQGSVIELERLAGEPLDVLVNGTLIAHGEVVVVNDKFGIRLTDVISQVERIKSFNKMRLLLSLCLLSYAGIAVSDETTSGHELSSASQLFTWLLSTFAILAIILVVAYL